jgi:hypothetical protein
MGSGNSSNRVKNSSILYPEQIQTFENIFKMLVRTEKRLDFKTFNVKRL